MSKWVTIVCIAHCVAMPLAGLCFAGGTDLHDSPIAHAMEGVLVCFSACNAILIARRLRARGRRMHARIGMLAGAIAVTTYVIGAHALLVGALLAVAGFQFHAHRSLRCGDC